MSDSQSSPFFSAVGQGLQGFANDVAYDPATLGLLNAGANLAAAGAPSRLPVPFGLAFSQGALGFGQGTQQALRNQMSQQQVKQLQLNNALQGALAPAKMQAAQNAFGIGSGNGSTNVPFGVPNAAPGAGMSFGSGGGQGGSAGSSGGIGGTGDASGGSLDPATAAIRNLQAQLTYARLSGNSRDAASIQQTLNGIAGPGGVIGADGRIYQAGGAYDTRQNAAYAEAAGKGAGGLPYNEQEAAFQAGLNQRVHAANAGVDAGYANPVETTQLGADGQYHTVYTPRPAWAGQTGAGAGSQENGMIPAPLYADRIKAVENSTGNPGAGNSASSAVGDGQFLSSTWLPLFRQNYPQASSLSDQQVLNLRSNPQISADMTVAYARQNAGLLLQAGAPPTAQNLGMAHQLGPQGALTVIGAPDNAPMSNLLPPPVIQANPQYSHMTAGQYRSLAGLRYGFAPVDLGGTSNAPAAQAGGQGTAPGAIVGKPVLTPEQQTASTGLGTLQNQIMDAGSKAPVGLQRLAVIDNAAQGFRPGLTGDARLTAARAITDGLQSIGITPPAWIANGAAAGETIGKEGGYLATELTRSLGSREALGVFNQVRNISPNIEMSNGGFQVVTNSIRQGLQRDQDLATYQDQWLQNPSHGGSIRGMLDSFEQSHPMQAYASRVVPFPVPSSQSKLQANVIYRNAQGQPALWDGSRFQPIPAGN